MIDDPLFPRLHFCGTPWMNDPIPFYHDGKYHVYFQHHPHGAYWADMHWGHAVSSDLARWTRKPIALAPGPKAYDARGIFTGCVVADHGHLYAFYTSISREPKTADHNDQSQSVATSDDGLHWRKHPGNPLIETPPAGLPTGPCFRDPHVWREDDGWRMLVGSDLPGKAGGQALLYRSDDLYNWEYLHPLFAGAEDETGHEFECPDFFPLGGRHMLLTSSGRTYWHLGDYAGQRFTRTAYGPCDTNAFYAAKTLLDGRGRRLLFGWLREKRGAEAQKAAGWSGVLSFPRELYLREDGSPGMRAPEELASLRGKQQAFQDLKVGKDAPLVLSEVRGDALEILVRLTPSPGMGRVGLRLRATPDGQAGTDLWYDRATGRLHEAALPLAPGETLELRIFLDRSVIEVFANERICQTLRTYPEQADALHLALLNGGGEPATFERVEVWELGG